jgi:hypothetical protein
MKIGDRFTAVLILLHVEANPLTFCQAIETGSFESRDMGEHVLCRRPPVG